MRKFQFYLIFSFLTLLNAQIPCVTDSSFQIDNRATLLDQPNPTYGDTIYTGLCSCLDFAPEIIVNGDTVTFTLRLIDNEPISGFMFDIYTNAPELSFLEVTRGEKLDGWVDTLANPVSATPLYGNAINNFVRILGMTFEPNNKQSLGNSIEGDLVFVSYLMDENTFVPNTLELWLSTAIISGSSQSEGSDLNVICDYPSENNPTSILISGEEIVINEIMNNPNAVSDEDGEWFEIYNAGQDTVDINGWVFKDSDDDSLSLDVDCCLEIAPNEYFLLVSNGDINTNGGISNHNYTYNRSDFTLGNSDDEIIIFNAYGFEIDRVEYDGGTTFPDPNGKSMELNFYNNDNSLGSNWVESEFMMPSGDYGTPGYANSMLKPEINIESIYTNQEYLLVNSGSFDPPELGDCIVTNFPEHTIGPCDTAYFSIVIENNGTADLIVDDYHFTEDLFPIEGNRWNVNDSLPIVIPPLSYDSLIVQFIPWRFNDFEYWYGIRNNTLILNNNDANNDSVSVDLSIPVVLDGRGYVLEGIDWNLGQDMFDLPNVDFGDVLVGGSADTTIKLTSYGNEELEVDGVSSANTPFSLISDDGGLALYEVIDIEINFSPQNSGDFSDTISIESNAQMYYPTFIVDLPGPQMIPPQPKFIIKGSGTVLSIDDEIVPEVFALHQNYPNPFNPVTSLRYDLPEDGLVNITIYDMMGRIVKTLVNNSQTAGYKSVQWNATNDRNEPVSAGLYLYTIQAGEFRKTRKMVLLK